MTYPSRIIGWPRFIHPGWKVMLDAGMWPIEITTMSLFNRGQDGFWLDPSDFNSLWMDEAKTTHPTLPGDVIWWLDDKSGNANHWAAPTSAARGRLLRWPASAVLEGAPRNKILNSDNASSATGTSGSTIEPGLVLGPDGRISASRAITTASSGNGMYLNTLVTAGVEYTFHFYLKQNDGTGLPPVAFYNNNAAAFITTNAVKTVEPAENGYSRITAKVTPPVGCTSMRAHPVRSASGTSGPFNYDIGNLTLELGAVANPYQRVGVGIWDVTETGQADCWGIYGDGVTTQYISTRGIPSFANSKLRLAMGQAKQKPDNVANSCLLTNASISSDNNRVIVLTNLTSNRSYGAVYRTATNITNITGAEYPSPNAAILDSLIQFAPTITIDFMVNNDVIGHTTSGLSGTVTNATWSLFNYRTAPTLSAYNGPMFGAVLVNEEPDENKWEIGVRRWMSDNNMGGILND